MGIPLVSVFVITYNQVDFVRETIESVLCQDYGNIEIVIADDGSTDGTAEIINEYAEKYPNIIVAITGGPNLGITGNSNRALSYCNGLYIAFLGGDDVFLPGKIRRQVEWLEGDPNRVLCYHDMEAFDSVTRETLYYMSQRTRFHDGSVVNLIRHGNYIGGTTVMIRSPQNAKVGFDPRVPVASDWLFWVDVVKVQGGVIGHIEGVYAKYRIHSRNVTKVSDHFLIDNLTTLQIIREKYPGYAWDCCVYRSEVLFSAAIRAFKRREKGVRVLGLLLRSILSCYGLWVAPFSMFWRKLDLSAIRMLSKPKHGALS